MEYKIDCVIVTYNRLSLLQECINSVLGQTYNINTIFVVDNNSTDGTRKYLDSLTHKISKVKSITLKRNLGGAGGFNVGLKSFINNSDADYVWIMDDDTVPNKDALEKLVHKIPLVKKLGFLSSNVRWRDGSIAKMNVPTTSPDWNALSNYGIIKLKTASFVSLLFSRNMIENIGYPIAPFFIWGDDIEYTFRSYAAGYNNYFVSSSMVEHKIKNNTSTNIFMESNPNRINRYYFDSRNRMYISRKYYGKKNQLKLIINQGIIQPVKLMLSHSPFKFEKAGIVFKGTFSGITFNPKVEK